MKSEYRNPKSESNPDDQEVVTRSCFRTSRAAVRRGWRSQARSDEEQYCIEIRRGGATQHGTARRKQRPCEVLKPLLLHSTLIFVSLTATVSAVRTHCRYSPCGGAVEPA